MIKRMTALALAMLCSGAAVAQDNYACRSAISSYNLAMETVSSALRGFSNCVANSRGREDCSFEFSRLRSAHADFEIAVSRYRRECSRY